jgi:hypothetical protein
MRTLRLAAAAAALALAVVTASAGPASAIAVAVGTGSAIAGQTVDIDMNVATTLTGLNVKSLQYQITYNPAYVTPTAIITTGTLTGTAAWPTPAFGISSISASQATLGVSAAGTTALSGSGSMLKMRFLINPAQLNAIGIGLGLSNFIFNEGSPTVTMTSGSVTINATPIITVGPDNVELIRGQTQQYSVSGSVTLPVQWFTTNNAVATINSSGLLTGVAPGAVQVFAVDNAGRRDTTAGTAVIRGMGITVTSTSGLVNSTLQVPITVTSLTGLGIRAGQFTITYNGTYGTAVGVTTPPGTLLNGWGTVGFGSFANGGTGSATVDFVGSTDLNGAGVLCYLQFQSANGLPAGIGGTFTQALFNETLVAKPTNGSINFTALPTITVNPDQVTLLAGQTQQMSLTGTPTNPITWSVVDPFVASINSAGLLTALHGGVTQVKAVDNVGATDLNTSVTVYDFLTTVGTITGAPGATVRVPITSDRFVGGLGIYSMQYTLSWVTLQPVVQSLPSSLIGTWGPGSTVDGPGLTSIRVAAAGATPLPNNGKDLAALEFQIPLTAVSGQDFGLSLTSLLFNEGYPRSQVVNGLLRVRSTTGVEDGGQVAFALAPAQPNPAHGATRLHFSLPAAARVQLEVIGVDGRRVRTLIDASMTPGDHEVVWDGRDESGQAVAPGLYFDRLTSAGRTLSHRIVLTR